MTRAGARARSEAASVRPRPVYAVTGHLRRDRRVADDACAGRFTEVGVTLRLGPEPDWVGAHFPDDEEWRIAWSKFYFGLDLAAAFSDTGDPAYQRAWERLVSSWIVQVPIGIDPSDAVGRRLLNWIYAWSTLATSEGFAGIERGLDARLVDSIQAQLTWLVEHLTPARNHRTLELYAVFIVALALPEVDPGGGLLDFALAELDRNLATDFRSDGVHIEASTHYHMVVLRSFVGLRENALRFGIALPTDFDERLSRALDFALHCHRPDGAIPALSDADTGRYAELLQLAGERLGREDYLWVASRGVRGAPPRARNVSFPAGGYHVQRSGWGEGGTAFEQERFLILDCGPLGEGGHGHYDLLSVELAAGGRPLVIDPGRYTYHEGEGNLRHWFKGTAAHNTVCVDGLDQTEYWRRKPKGPVAEGRFRGRIQTPGLDVLWGEAVSPRYDARHARRVLFVAGEYWVFEDRLSGERPHRFDQRWHLAPDAEGAVALTSGERGTVVQAPGLALVFAPGVQVRIEDGWYSPVYGIKHPAPVVSATVDGVVDACLVTLAVPLASPTPAPALTAVVEGDGWAMVEVEGVGPGGSARDAIAWSLDGEPAALPQLGRAQAAWRRSRGVGR